jgi:selenocysteine-specific elongation factor
MSSLRQNIMLGTAGHVDHGKTALVKLLTGCETDTLAEEKQRGMTIDLGFAPCHLADKRVVGVVDVPGHVDFVRNMVAGAHGVDVVIFVVAADDGVMPQTREHLSILDLMGLRHGLVALTKIDLIEPGRRGQVAEAIRRLLRGTFLERAPICPLSNITGEGYDSFFESLNAACDACSPKSTTGYFRLWTEDVFSIRGFGTVVTGIPTSGAARLGDRFELVPEGLTARLRHLQVYGEESTEGRAGECVALNLSELDHQVIRRGQVICEPGTSPPVSMVEAELGLLPDYQGELKDFAEVHLHVGTAAVQARLAMLAEPRLSPGQTQMVQLRLSQPLGIVAGDRFVIRSQASQAGLMTIGGGRILDTSNIKLRRQKSWTLTALSERRAVIDDAAGWCELVLRQAGKPLSLADWCRASRLPPQELRLYEIELAARGQILALSEEVWLHQETMQRLEQQVLERLQQYHQANDQRLGQRPEDLRLACGLETCLFDRVLERLQQRQRVMTTGSLIALAGWSPRTSSAAEVLGDRVQNQFKQAGWTTPSLEELALSLREPLDKTQAAAQRLIDQGLLVRLDEKVLMHRDAIEAGRQLALRLFRQAPTFSTMEFRDAMGVSRKYAVPLLDYFDKNRLTVRSGNHRLPGAEAKKLML